MGDVHTVEEMKDWLQALGCSDAIKDATINTILREFLMSKVSCDEMSNMDMVVELLRPQLEVIKEDIEPFLKLDAQRQTCLGYGMARKCRMKCNQSLSWACIIIVTLLFRQVHL